MSLTITTPSEATYALAAALMEDFAPSKQHQLLAFTDTFQGLFNARSSDFDAPISTEIARVQRQLQRIEWRPRSAEILSECQRLGVRLLVVTEDDYPPLLKQIAVPPPILFVLGDYTNLHLPQLAVVGSRRMTSGRRSQCTSLEPPPHHLRFYYNQRPRARRRRCCARGGNRG